MILPAPSGMPAREVRVELWHLPLLLAGGFLCGVINALAGGGSFLTIPLLLFMGLPPQVANATNRVAIALQCAAGIGAYQRGGVRPWRHLPLLALATLPGSLLGAYLAATLDETVFRRTMAGLFIVMLLTLFLDPRRWDRPTGGARLKPWVYPLFFIMGLYGGFLQAGVGVLLIGSLVLLAGFDVVSGNALKFGLAFLSTLTAMLVFAGFGQVRWVTGLVLAIGSIAGGWVGARLVMAKGLRWVRWMVVAAALAAIAKLLLGD